MTQAAFATYVRAKTRTNTSTFTDAEILAFMLIRQDELAREIMKADQDIFTIPQTDNLVASSVTAREYAQPADVLPRIKRVEALFDGSTWIKLVAIDQSRIEHALDETTITNHFANTQGDAFYTIQRKAVYIYSGTISAVTNGLKIWIKTYPAVITDLSLTTDMSVDPTTTSHGMPRELHEIWARGVIIDYKESKEKPIALTERELKYEVDKQVAIQSLMHGTLDLEVLPGLPDASERGNEGFNY